MALFGDHLGPRLAALVDGELSHDDRDRALAHIAGCAQCRSLVESERTLKGRLGAMAMPEPSARLMAALFQIPQTHGGRREPEDGPPPGGESSGTRPGSRGGIFGRSASSFLPEFAAGLRPAPQPGANGAEPDEGSGRRGYARAGQSAAGAGRSPLRPEYAQPALRPAWFAE
jgi:anti-sigma factor RsiW